MTGAEAVPMTGSEFAGWLAVTAGAAGGAAVAGYRRYFASAETPKLREDRLDALIALTRSFEAFALTVQGFISHVQEQHESHRREMQRQTEILDRMSLTVTKIEARQEVHGR